jgi:dihydroorotate dehydrogenase
VSYRRLGRPLVFRLDPERAHEMVIGGLERLAPMAWGGRGHDDPRLAQNLLGLRFPNPVGLAAGFDKYARAVPWWAALGFGFAEIGTVTARPQEGNPKPRIVRLPDDGALINRLGFNNAGAEATAARLAAWERAGCLHRIPLGINIGRSRDTPPEEAVGDYLESLRRLRPFADYLVVNVSSPNTPGLRDLQEREALEGLLGALLAEERALAGDGVSVPLLVKVAPDLDEAALETIVGIAADAGAAGIVVANTTVTRDGLRSPPDLAAEPGGLSGRPLRARSTALVRRAARLAAGRVLIVGVGGVFGPEDAWEKLLAGASLVQVYTGLVYEGPGVARRIVRGIAERLDRVGAERVADVVGWGAG